MEITREQIKLMQLQSQGLLSPISKPAQKADVIQTIRKIEMLQIDTIHVVARSPYFVLWSRLGNYPPNWLDELQSEGLLFEYWSHAACFIPIEQFPFFRSKMTIAHSGWRNSDTWRNNNKDIIEFVLLRIREKGPTRSADFERKGSKKNGWWDWKEEKIALEYLWTHGELMIPYRIKFQRYYDLTERVYPEYNQTGKSIEEAIQDQVERSVRVLGASRMKWISDYYRLSKVATERIVNELVRAKKVTTINSKEWNEDIFVHHSNSELMDNALSNRLKPKLTTLLSPFDPLIWDRKRTMDLFDFDYSIECYLPSNKRKFGYFCLPILFNGNIVGRVDAKANRQNKTFEIKSLHFENGFVVNTQFKIEFCKMLLSCSGWHHTPTVVFSENVPVELKQTLEPLLTQGMSN
ncbi:MAG: winged helix-turn-helix domain-containing protein [Anaerolineaceae bacterium]